TYAEEARAHVSQAECIEVEAVAHGGAFREQVLGALQRDEVVAHGRAVSEPGVGKARTERQQSLDALSPVGRLVTCRAGTGARRPGASLNASGERVVVLGIERPGEHPQRFGRGRRWRHKPRMPGEPD